MAHSRGIRGRMKHRFILVLAALLLSHMVTLAMPMGALAQTIPINPVSPGDIPRVPLAPINVPIVSPTPTSKPAATDQCTDFKGSKDAAFGQPGVNPDGTAKKGLLTEIYGYIKDIVNDSTERLFNAFVESTAYQSAVYGAATLMIVIFGVGFVIGVIQPSFGQVLVRLIKLGIILTLVSPGGWGFFQHYMVTFFNDGTDQLVLGVTSIGTGMPPPEGASPFYQFDRLAEFLIQPDTIVAILGSVLAGGPYGLMMGGLMVFAFWGFIQLLIDALRIYAVSYVARALLLGLAPIFFVFLLFEKTKQLFMTWLNALLSLSLQPILLFTFLSFFMVLIESASQDMLSTEFCWTEFKSGEGTTNKWAFWRPTDANGNPIRGEMTWQGTVECIAKGESLGTAKCPEFPMNIIDILSFLILVYLAQRFAKVIERIANELANTYIALDTGGRFDQFMAKNESREAIGRTGGGTNRNNPPSMAGNRDKN